MMRRIFQIEAKIEDNSLILRRFETIMWTVLAVRHWLMNYSALPLVFDWRTIAHCAQYLLNRGLTEIFIFIRSLYMSARALLQKTCIPV